MSFVGLNYDNSTYEQKLRESVGPGMYMLGTPDNDDNDCARDIPSDPYLRYQQWGRGFCDYGSTVDVSSDLFNINRKASKCPADQYHPSKTTVNQGCLPKGKVGAECMTPTEPTRLSNPACNNREWTVNRWEWLCIDPQTHALEQFEYNISYRNVVKDNHKPQIPVPMSQEGCFPPNTQGGGPSVKIERYVPPTNLGSTGSPYSDSIGGQPLWASPLGK